MKKNKILFAAFLSILSVKTNNTTEQKKRPFGFNVHGNMYIPLDDDALEFVVGGQVASGSHLSDIIFSFSGGIRFYDDDISAAAILSIPLLGNKLAGTAKEYIRHTCLSLHVAWELADIPNLMIGVQANISLSGVGIGIIISKKINRYEVGGSLFYIKELEIWKDKIQNKTQENKSKNNNTTDNNTSQKNVPNNKRGAPDFIENYLLDEEVLNQDHQTLIQAHSTLNTIISNSSNINPEKLFSINGYQNTKQFTDNDSEQGETDSDTNSDNETELNLDINSSQEHNNDKNYPLMLRFKDLKQCFIEALKKDNIENIYELYKVSFDAKLAFCACKDIFQSVSNDWLNLFDDLHLLNLKNKKTKKNLKQRIVEHIKQLTDFKVFEKDIIAEVNTNIFFKTILNDRMYKDNFFISTYPESRKKVLKNYVNIRIKQQKIVKDCFNYNNNLDIEQLKNSHQDLFEINDICGFKDQNAYFKDQFNPDKYWADYIDYIREHPYLQNNENEDELSKNIKNWIVQNNSINIEKAQSKLGKMFNKVVFQSLCHEYLINMESIIKQIINGEENEIEYDFFSVEEVTNIINQLKSDSEILRIRNVSYSLACTILNGWTGKNQLPLNFKILNLKSLYYIANDCFFENQKKEDEIIRVNFNHKYSLIKNAENIYDKIQEEYFYHAYSKDDILTVLTNLWPKEDLNSMNEEINKLKKDLDLCQKQINTNQIQKQSQKEEINRLKEEIKLQEKLIQDIENGNNVDEQLKQERDRLVNKITELEQNINDLSDENQKLIEESEKEKNNYLDQIQKLEEEKQQNIFNINAIEKKQLEIDMIIKRLEENKLQSEIKEQNLKHDASKQKETIKNLEQKIEILNKKIEVKETASNTNEQELEEKIKTLTLENNKINIEISNLTQNLNKISNEKDELTKQQKEFLETQSQNEQKNEIIATLNEEIQQLKNQIQQNKYEIDELNRSINSEDKDQLDIDLKTEKIKLEEDKKEFQNNLNILKQQIDDLNNQIQKLTQETSQKESDIKLLEEKNNELIAEKDNLKLENDQKDNEIDNLNTEILELKNQIEILDKKNGELSEQVSNFEDEINQKNTLIQELQKHLDTSNENKDNKINKLEEEISQLQLKIKNIQSSIPDSEKLIENNQQKIEELQQELADKQAIIDSLKSNNNDDILQKIASLQEENEEKNIKIQDLTFQIEGFKSEKQELEIEKDELNKKIEKLEAKIEELQKEKNENENKIQNLSDIDQIKELKKQNEDKRKQIQTLIQENKNLKAEHRTINNKINKSTKQSYGNEKKKLEKELEKIKKEYQVLSNKNQELSSYIEILQKSHKEKDLKIQRLESENKRLSLLKGKAESTQQDMLDALDLLNESNQILRSEEHSKENIEQAIKMINEESIQNTSQPLNSSSATDPHSIMDPQNASQPLETCDAINSNPTIDNQNKNTPKAYSKQDSKPTTDTHKKTPKASSKQDSKPTTDTQNKKTPKPSSKKDSQPRTDSKNKNTPKASYNNEFNPNTQSEILKSSSKENATDFNLIPSAMYKSSFNNYMEKVCKNEKNCIDSFKISLKANTDDYSLTILKKINKKTKNDDVLLECKKLQDLCDNKNQKIIVSQLKKLLNANQKKGIPDINDNFEKEVKKLSFYDFFELWALCDQDFLRLIKQALAIKKIKTNTVNKKEFFAIKDTDTKTFYDISCEIQILEQIIEACQILIAKKYTNSTKILTIFYRINMENKKYIMQKLKLNSKGADSQDDLKNVDNDLKERRLPMNRTKYPTNIGKEGSGIRNQDKITKATRQNPSEAIKDGTINTHNVNENYKKQQINQNTQLNQAAGPVSRSVSSRSVDSKAKTSVAKKSATSNTNKSAVSKSQAPVSRSASASSVGSKARTSVSRSASADLKKKKKTQ